MSEKIKVIKVSYHRNGVAGEGFNVVTFNWKDEHRKNHHMVATLFKTSGQCAVLDIDETLKDNIEFACGNSWRGDHFEDALRLEIKKANDEFDERMKLKC